MNDIMLIVILQSIGFFCLGAITVCKQVVRWRLRSIILEHDLAREQKRKPRMIEEVIMATDREIDRLEGRG